MLGLGKLLDRRPGELSGGERQRVAMGRAIVREPKVFLFDEPLSNLDAALRAELRVEIAALVRRLGVTSIYVTHDQVEAMTMGDRIAVMRARRAPAARHAARDLRGAGERVRRRLPRLAADQLDRARARWRRLVGRGRALAPRPRAIDLPRARAVGVRPEHADRCGERRPRRSRSRRW